jgi:hypothetical protein
MTAKKVLGRIGISVAALVVSALFFVCTLAIYYFFGVSFFRLGFYLPALGIVLFLYFGKKRRGFFLESFAFLLALLLAMVITLNLIVVI